MTRGVGRPKGAGAGVRPVERRVGPRTAAAENVLGVRDQGVGKRKPDPKSLTPDARSQASPKTRHPLHPPARILHHGLRRSAAKVFVESR